MCKIPLHSQAYVDDCATSITSFFPILMFFLFFIFVEVAAKIKKTKQN